MKKISLLLIIGFFIFGIQSCSNEEIEIGVEENINNGLPENAVPVGQSGKMSSEYYAENSTPQIITYSKLYVIYPSNATLLNRQLHAQTEGVKTYGEKLYVEFDNGCDLVDTWYIPCIGCVRPETEKPNNLIQVASSSNIGTTTGIAVDADMADGDDENEDGMTARPDSELNPDYDPNADLNGPNLHPVGEVENIQSMPRFFRNECSKVYFLWLLNQNEGN